MANCSVDLNVKSLPEVVLHVFETIDASSARVYKFALAGLLSIERHYGLNKDELNATVLHATKSMANKEQNNWITLLPVLDSDVLSIVRTDSEAPLEHPSDMNYIRLAKARLTSYSCSTML